MTNDTEFQPTRRVCHAVLSIGGENYPCDANVEACAPALPATHDVHSSTAAEAIWVGHDEGVHLAELSAASTNSPS